MVRDTMVKGALVFAWFDRVKRSVCARVADYAWALVGESRKRQGLAHFQDVLPVHFVLQQRVTRRIRGRSVRGRQWLSSAERKTNDARQ